MAAKSQSTFIFPTYFYDVRKKKINFCLMYKTYQNTASLKKKIDIEHCIYTVKSRKNLYNGLLQLRLYIG